LLSFQEVDAKIDAFISVTAAARSWFTILPQEMEEKAH